MHLYNEVKEMLHHELEDVIKRGDVDMNSLEVIDTLLNSIKNAEKIIMYNRYGDSGYSYDDGYSNARGRRGNVKRDSMGRYARNEGYSREGYSRGGYSYDDGEKEDKMQMLREMMNEAGTEQERSMIRSMIDRMQG